MAHETFITSPKCRRQPSALGKCQSLCWRPVFSRVASGSSVAQRRPVGGGPPQGRVRRPQCAVAVGGRRPRCSTTPARQGSGGPGSSIDWRRCGPDTRTHGRCGATAIDRPRGSRRGHLCPAVQSTRPPVTVRLPSSTFAWCRGDRLWPASVICDL